MLVGSRSVATAFVNAHAPTASSTMPAMVVRAGDRTVRQG